MQHPPLFADDVAAMPQAVNSAFDRYAKRLPAIFVPLLERLTIVERVAIEANRSISELAEMFDANEAALRNLLLPIPPSVVALPAVGRTGDSSATAAAETECGARGDETGIRDPDAAYTSVETLVAHLARDWSEMGAVPRARTYRPLLRALGTLQRERRRPLRIFVPGAGAGRLAWEVAQRGHRVEANDASAVMLIAARAIIGGPHDRSWRLFPRAGCAGGLAPRASCRCAADISLPTSRGAANGAAAQAGRLTLHVGSWCSDAHGARRNASFDAVVTSYFLDALPDPAAAVRTVRRLLRPGGVWLNVGPLHWHHPAAGMLRLTLDELLALIALHGFARVDSRRLGAVPYLVSGAGRERWPWPWRRRTWRQPAPLEDEWHDVVLWVARVPQAEV